MASKLELLLGLSKSIDDAAEAAASSGISGLAEELTNLYGILTDLITLGEAQLDDPTTADKYEELRETVDALVGIAAGAGAGIIFTAAVAGFWHPNYWCDRGCYCQRRRWFHSGWVRRKTARGRPDASERLY